MGRGDSRSGERREASGPRRRRVSAIPRNFFGVSSPPRNNGRDARIFKPGATVETNSKSASRRVERRSTRDGARGHSSVARSATARGAHPARARLALGRETSARAHRALPRRAAPASRAVDAPDLPASAAVPRLGIDGRSPHARARADGEGHRRVFEVPLRARGCGRCVKGFVPASEARARQAAEKRPAPAAAPLAPLDANAPAAKRPRGRPPGPASSKSTTKRLLRTGREDAQDARDETRGRDARLPALLREEGAAAGSATRRIPGPAPRRSRDRRPPASTTRAPPSSASPPRAARVIIIITRLMM